MATGESHGSTHVLSLPNFIRYDRGTMPLTKPMAFLSPRTT